MWYVYFKYICRDISRLELLYIGGENGFSFIVFICFYGKGIAFYYCGSCYSLKSLSVILYTAVALPTVIGPRLSVEHLDRSCPSCCKSRGCVLDAPRAQTLGLELLSKIHMISAQTLGLGVFSSATHHFKHQSSLSFVHPT